MRRLIINCLQKMADSLKKKPTKSEQNKDDFKSNQITEKQLQEQHQKKLLAKSAYNHYMDIYQKRSALSLPEAVRKITNLKQRLQYGLNHADRNSLISIYEQASAITDCMETLPSESVDNASLYHIHINLFRNTGKDYRFIQFRDIFTGHHSPADNSNTEKIYQEMSKNSLFIQPKYLLMKLQDTIKEIKQDVKDSILLLYSKKIPTTQQRASQKQLNEHTVVPITTKSVPLMDDGDALNHALEDLKSKAKDMHGNELLNVKVTQYKDSEDVRDSALTADIVLNKDLATIPSNQKIQDLDFNASVALLHRLEGNNNYKTDY